MELEKLHNELFDFLIMIDQICKENQLRYYIDAGTELGAVRHKDFIPWDDDIDIKIFAEDWPHFKEVMDEKLPSHIHLYSPLEFAPAFFDFVPKINDLSGLKHPETEEDKFYKNIPNRQGVDVFLFCKVPDNKLSRFLFDVRNRMLYGMGMRYRYSLDKSKYSFKELMQVNVLTFLGRFTTAEKIYKKWFKHLMKYNHLEKNYCYYTSNYTLDDIRYVPSYIYETTKEGQIRDHFFPIPGRAEEELTIFYGDWKTPRETVKENGKTFERHQ